MLCYVLLLISFNILYWFYAEFSFSAASFKHFEFAFFCKFLHQVIIHLFLLLREMIKYDQFGTELL